MAEQVLGGKVAIVTGAGRGLGRTMAHALLRAGANVTMFERDADALDEAVREAKDIEGAGSVLTCQGDVTSEQDAADTVARTIERFGGLHVLVNNAALGPQTFQPTNLGPRPRIWNVEVDLWRRILGVNASGPFIMACAALPHLLEQGWGRIINVTTSLDTMWRTGMGPYGPAKACAEAFTASLAGDLEGTGVSANVLVPGGRADTRMIPEDGEFTDRSLLVPRDVMAAPVVWLASDASNGINNMRFRAALFDPDLPTDQAAEAAGAPAAWPQLGNQAIR
jgi:NAD(P)-dependent dehydrogenase (short-subunit alcohol dehydrogenase family)